jgi:hypothetical protein
VANYARNMKQTATYWARTGQNAAAEPTFAAPVAVQCRWEDKAVLFKDAEGRERMSRAIVYPATPLQLQGWLFLGTSATANPRTVVGAFEILQTGASPNLGNTLTLNKVFL